MGGRREAQVENDEEGEDRWEEMQEEERRT